MWPFKKEQSETKSQELTQSATETELSPISEPKDEWSMIRVEGSKIIYDEQPMDGADPVNVSSSDNRDIKERVREEIMSRYPVDDFHKNVIKIAYFFSKVGKLQSLDIDKNDEDFFAACEVIHRRLANPALEPVLKFMANDDIQDIFVLYYGLGPLVSDVYAEVQAKKKARVARKMGPQRPIEVEIETEIEPITPQSEEKPTVQGSDNVQS